MLFTVTYDLKGNKHLRQLSLSNLHTPTPHSLNIPKQKTTMKSIYGDIRPPINYSTNKQQKIHSYLTSLQEDDAQIKLLNYPWNDSSVISHWELKILEYSTPKDSTTLKHKICANQL